MPTALEISNKMLR